jgi:hypothetical protein
MGKQRTGWGEASYLLGRAWTGWASAAGRAGLQSVESWIAGKTREGEQNVRLEREELGRAWLVQQRGLPKSGN